MNISAVEQTGDSNKQHQDSYHDKKNWNQNKYNSKNDFERISFYGFKKQIPKKIRKNI
jgi:hypothetical protein